ncbi:MAG: DUF4123 domain-containing protein [Myxococcales bacterium]|nr:DUF4123 domain-containing protein [Myxococcales bacterium]
MTAAAQVLATLGKGPTYAVLDGARDPRVAGLAKGELVRCLYRGTLPKEVAEAAPYLMRVWPGNEPTERFFSQGWQQAWGVLLAYAGPIKALYRHLRQFLRVRGEDGRAFAFRWYDPRVLRVYLPTCTPAEIGRFFGPIEAFAVEDEAPDTFHVFRRAMRGFEQRRVSRNDPSRLLRTWDHAEAPDRRDPLILFRARQLRAFQERMDERYLDQLIRMLRKQLPLQLTGFPHSRIRDRCRDALTRAAAYGLRGDDVLSFIAMTWTISPHFDSHPSFREIFRDSTIAGSRKLPAIFERVGSRQWIEARRLD